MFTSASKLSSSSKLEKSQISRLPSNGYFNRENKNNDILYGLVEFITFLNPQPRQVRHRDRVPGLQSLLLLSILRQEYYLTTWELLKLPALVDIGWTRSKMAPLKKQGNREWIWEGRTINGHFMSTVVWTKGAQNAYPGLQWDCRRTLRTLHQIIIRKSGKV